MSSAVEHAKRSALEQKDGRFAAWNLLACFTDEKFYFAVSLEKKISTHFCARCNTVHGVVDKVANEFIIVVSAFELESIMNREPD